MLAKIKKLEKIARKLEIKSDKRAEWNKAVLQNIDEFLEVYNPKVTFGASVEVAKGITTVTIPKEGRPLEELLPLIDKYVNKTSLNPASGGSFGYIPGGGVYPTALADYMVAATNKFTGTFYACPGGVYMENHLLKWMCELVGYPKEALGNLSSGGSIANLSAITTARDVKGIKGKDIERCVIYLTHQVHHCVQKAIRIAGMQEAIIRYIPVDREFRMEVSALEQQLQVDKEEGLFPFLVVASAGTTNTGTIDPLDQIAPIAKAYNLWFHVDAAYGGFFMLSSKFKSLFKGIEASDSLAIDPHKGLFISYGLGALLIKDVQALYKTHHYVADYMQDAYQLEGDVSPADLSPELTRHFRGMRMWLSLQLFGTEPFRAALEEKIWLCRYFYEKVQKIGFEVGPYPDLSICIFRYISKSGDANAINDWLVEAVKKDGRVFFSTTTLDGIYWIRFAVLSFRTHLEQVDLAISIIKDILNSTSFLELNNVEK